jgi:hypothetical protein
MMPAFSVSSGPPVRWDDPVAGLGYDAAPQAYSAVAGSERALRAAVEQSRLARDAEM